MSEKRSLWFARTNTFLYSGDKIGHHSINSDGIAAESCFVLLWNMSLLDSFKFCIELVFMSQGVKTHKKSL